MEQLYINNQLVDLETSNGKIQMTFIINGLGDISKKQSSYSSSIKLPKTANNVRILKGLGTQGSTTRIQYDRLPCRYSYNNIDIIANGFLIINESNQTYFQCSIYSGIVELSNAIKSKKLNDLNLSFLTHQINLTNFDDIINNDSLPYTYTTALNVFEKDRDGRFLFAEFGTYSLNNRIPLVKSEHLLREIFEQNNFVLEGDLFNDSLLYEKFEREYITIEKGFDRNISFTRTQLFDDPQLVPNISIQSDVFVNDEPFYFQLGGYAGTNANTINMTYNENTFEINNSKLLELDFRINTSLDSSITKGTEFALILQSNQNEDRYFRFENDTEFGLTQNLSIPVSDDELLSLSLEVKPELVQVQNQSDKYELDFDITFDIDIDVYEPSIITREGNRDFSFGEITQQQFILDILNRYGLLLNKVSNTNRFELKNINNLLTIEPNNSVDWTDKLDVITSTSYTNSYGQENYFKWRYSKDDDAGIFDKSFFLDNKLAINQKTIHTCPFQLFPTKSEGFDLDFFIPYYSLELDDNDNNVIVTNDSVKPRLVSIDNSREVLYNLRNTEEDFNVVSVKSKLNILEYPTDYKYVFDNYYNKLFKLIENYKLVKSKVKLDLFDIRNLDFYKLIYLQQTGKYYYLNEIKYSVQDSIHDVELVEIPLIR